MFLCDLWRVALLNCISENTFFTPAGFKRSLFFNKASVCKGESSQRFGRFVFLETVLKMWVRFPHQCSQERGVTILAKASKVEGGSRQSCV